MTSTALVPIMDTQVLDICQQLKRNPIDEVRKLMVAKTAQAIAAIKATISNLSIEGAIAILDAFNYANDEIHYKGDKWSIKDIIDEQYFPFHQGRMATETVIFQFWGGPPAKLSWYRGTLQTMLEDRILYEIHRKGAASIAMMIGTDLEALVPPHPTTRLLGC